MSEDDHLNRRDFTAAGLTALFRLPRLKVPDLTLVLLTIVGLTMLFVVTSGLWFSHGGVR